MAGSYGHVDLRDGAWSNIETMGDACECVEQLLFLIALLIPERKIKNALEEFHQFGRGERDPDKEDTEASDAWNKVQKVMQA